MADDSKLDQRYFIDDQVYNCPFCNRNNVRYSVSASFFFDWTNEKKCFGYLVLCHSCNKKSMHLSYESVGLLETYDGVGLTSFRKREGLDDVFFYSVPTSFFVLNDNIHKDLRELLTEGEGCLKSNFLTGASACARKIVYELAVLQKASGNNYDERIKSLKELKPEVDPTFFDSLLTVQQATSSKVHENSYDGWNAKHLRLIFSTLREILTEIYVTPALKEQRRKAIIDLKLEILGNTPKPSPTGELKP